MRSEEPEAPRETTSIRSDRRLIRSSRSYHIGQRTELSPLPTSFITLHRAQLLTDYTPASNHSLPTTMSRSTDAGPSSTTPTLAATLDQKQGVHIHPHSAHLQQVDEEEEHDYESLPVGAGWGVNMAAGALVSFCPGMMGFVMVSPVVMAMGLVLMHPNCHSSVMCS